MEHVEPSPNRPPVWFPIVLGVQIFLSLVILGLSADIIHGYYFNTLGFVIFACVLTWLMVVYHFSTVYASSLKQYRIPLAVLIADAVMVIFWLSAMGATAALRATFKYKVHVDDCYNDGGLVNSETCTVDRRSIERRAAIVTNTGLSMLSAIAGLSAIEMLLYVACLAFGVIAWNRTRTTDAATSYAPQKQNEGYPMEPAHQPYVQQPQTAAPQSYAQHSYDQGPYASQEQYVNQDPYGHPPAHNPIH